MRLEPYSRNDRATGSADRDPAGDINLAPQIAKSQQFACPRRVRHRGHSSHWSIPARNPKLGAGLDEGCASEFEATEMAVDVAAITDPHNHLLSRVTTLGVINRTHVESSLRRQRATVEFGTPRGPSCFDTQCVTILALEWSGTRFDQAFPEHCNVRGIRDHIEGGRGQLTAPDHKDPGTADVHPHPGVLGERGELMFFQAEPDHLAREQRRRFRTGNCERANTASVVESVGQAWRQKTVDVRKEAVQR